MAFGGLLGGAGGSGEACLSLQILQSMGSGSNHALLPLQGCGELKGYALCRSPFLAPSGHLGTTLEDHGSSSMDTGVVQNRIFMACGVTLGPYVESFLGTEA